MADDALWMNEEAFRTRTAQDGGGGDGGGGDGGGASGGDAGASAGGADAGTATSCPANCGGDAGAHMGESCSHVAGCGCPFMYSHGTYHKRKKKKHHGAAPTKRTDEGAEEGQAVYKTVQGEDEDDARQKALEQAAKSGFGGVEIKAIEHSHKDFWNVMMRSTEKIAQYNCDRCGLEATHESVTHTGTRGLLCAEHAVTYRVASAAVGIDIVVFPLNEEAFDLSTHIAAVLCPGCNVEELADPDKSAICDTCKERLTNAVKPFAEAWNQVVPKTGQVENPGKHIDLGGEPLCECGHPLAKGPFGHDDNGDCKAGSGGPKEQQCGCQVKRPVGGYSAFDEMWPKSAHQDEELEEDDDEQHDDADQMPEDEEEAYRLYNELHNESLYPYDTGGPHWGSKEAGLVDMAFGKYMGPAWKRFMTAKDQGFIDVDASRPRDWRVECATHPSCDFQDREWWDGDSDEGTLGDTKTHVRALASRVLKHLDETHSGEVPVPDRPDRVAHGGHPDEDPHMLHADRCPWCGSDDRSVLRVDCEPLVRINDGLSESPHPWHNHLDNPDARIGQVKYLHGPDDEETPAVTQLKGQCKGPGCTNIVHQGEGFKVGDDDVCGQYCADALMAQQQRERSASLRQTCASCATTLEDYDEGFCSECGFDNFKTAGIGEALFNALDKTNDIISKCPGSCGCESAAGCHCQGCPQAMKNNQQAGPAPSMNTPEPSISTPMASVTAQTNGACWECNGTGAKRCPTCRATSRWAQADPNCLTCGGTGSVHEECGFCGGDGVEKAPTAREAHSLCRGCLHNNHDAGLCPACRCQLDTVTGMEPIHQEIHNEQQTEHAYGPCPECGKPWWSGASRCPTCGLDYEDVEAAGAFFDRMQNKTAGLPDWALFVAPTLMGVTEMAKIQQHDGNHDFKPYPGRGHTGNQNCMTCSRPKDAKVHTNPQSLLDKTVNKTVDVMTGPLIPLRKKNAQNMGHCMKCGGTGDDQTTGLPCQDCGGTGKEGGELRCIACSGEGHLPGGAVCTACDGTGRSDLAAHPKAASIIETHDKLIPHSHDPFDEKQDTLTPTENAVSDFLTDDAYWNNRPPMTNQDMARDGHFHGFTRAMQEELKKTWKHKVAPACEDLTDEEHAIRYGQPHGEIEEHHAKYCDYCKRGAPRNEYPPDAEQLPFLDPTRGTDGSGVFNPPNGYGENWKAPKTAAKDTDEGETDEDDDLKLFRQDHLHTKNEDPIRHAEIHEQEHAGSKTADLDSYFEDKYQGWKQRRQDEKAQQPDRAHEKFHMTMWPLGKPADAYCPACRTEQIEREKQRSRYDYGCPHCGTGWNGQQCGHCGFEVPPPDENLKIGQADGGMSGNGCGICGSPFHGSASCPQSADSSEPRTSPHEHLVYHQDIERQRQSSGTSIHDLTDNVGNGTHSVPVELITDHYGLVAPGIDPATCRYCHRPVEEHAQWYPTRQKAMEAAAKPKPKTKPKAKPKKKTEENDFAEKNQEVAQGITKGINKVDRTLKGDPFALVSAVSVDDMSYDELKRHAIDDHWLIDEDTQTNHPLVDLHDWDHEEGNVDHTHELKKTREGVNFFDMDPETFNRIMYTPGRPLGPKGAQAFPGESDIWRYHCTDCDYTHDNVNPDIKKCPGCGGENVVKGNFSERLRDTGRTHEWRRQNPLSNKQGQAGTSIHDLTDNVPGGEPYQDGRRSFITDHFGQLQTGTEPAKCVTCGEAMSMHAQSNPTHQRQADVYKDIDAQNAAEPEAARYREQKAKEREEISCKGCGKPLSSVVRAMDDIPFCTNCIRNGRSSSRPRRGVV